MVKDRLEAAVVDVFERALGHIRARVSALSMRQPRNAAAVAYSGGLDSSVLLRLAHAWARLEGVELHAFHVHHGLSPHADQWLEHCAKECAGLGIAFHTKHVQVEPGDAGIEQAARFARYAALGDLSRQGEVPLLITGHHIDDQAETVLLQLLRGSGVQGLAGMEEAFRAPGLTGQPDLVIGRPLLHMSRATLEAFAAKHGIAHVQDESNADVRFRRNALRHDVMPVLAEHFPGFQSCLSRTAQHARAAQRLLDDLARIDLAACGEGTAIDVARLAALAPDRIDNLLRYWFLTHGMAMPATAWLAELRSQLLHAREDAQMRVVHPACEIRRHRGKALLLPHGKTGSVNRQAETFRWQGEPVIPFPTFDGALRFMRAPGGLDACWLQHQVLTLRLRRGGERLKSAPNRPTRPLKLHYQERDIPSWERNTLPLVFAEERLVFAAGIGINWKDVPTSETDGILLRWEEN